MPDRHSHESHRRSSGRFRTGALVVVLAAMLVGGCSSSTPAQGGVAPAGTAAVSAPGPVAVSAPATAASPADPQQTDMTTTEATTTEAAGTDTPGTDTSSTATSSTNPPGTNTSGTNMSGADAPPANGGIPGPDCLAVASSFASMMSGLLPVMSGGAGSFDAGKLQHDLDEMSASIPKELLPDFAAVGATVKAAAGKSLADAAQLLDDPTTKAATDRIDAWLSRNCNG